MTESSERKIKLSSLRVAKDTEAATNCLRSGVKEIVLANVGT